MWTTVIQFLLSLSLLILLHEGGHYIFARLFKTRVEKFYLFFDFFFPFSNVLPFSIFKKKIGDTVYGLGWFPLGGYVKIAGMIDESMDKEQLNQPPQPWEFRSKPAWQRLLIMLGGIIVNIITALIIFTCIFWAYGEKKLPMSEVNRQGGIYMADSFGYKIGLQDGDKIISIDDKPATYLNETLSDLLMGSSVVVQRNGEQVEIKLPINLMGQFVDNKNRMFFSYPFPTFVGEVLENSAAAQAGLMVKDQIISINGITAQNFFEFKKLVQENKGQEVLLGILRDGHTIQLTARVSDSGTIGFRPGLVDLNELDKLGYYKLHKQEYSLAEAIPAGIKTSWDVVKKNAIGLGRVFQPKTEAYKGVGSFISMAKIFGNEFDWQNFWRITALLSLVLAFMNLLPIPGLDGGYVIFTLWEMIVGKKVNDRVIEVATSIGLVLILMFMFFALGNDIFRNFMQ